MVFLLPQQHNPGPVRKEHGIVEGFPFSADQNFPGGEAFAAVGAAPQPQIDLGPVVPGFPALIAGQNRPASVRTRQGIRKQA